MKSSCLALALLGSVSAAPAVEKQALSNPLAKRNVCDGVDASPVLYHEYRGDSCPPINQYNADGSCAGQEPSVNDCVSFCQVRTTFTYGREAPIENSYCYGPFTCTVTETSTRTITKSASFNANWEWGIKLGVSGGYQYADQTARAQAFQWKLEEGECGYFTMVPVWRTTCGSVTEGSLRLWPVRICQPRHTTENVCVSDQRLNPSGTVDAVTIFVRTDCNNRQPLPPDRQNPVWNHDGVPLDRASYDAVAKGWDTVVKSSQGVPPARAFATGTCSFHLREEWPPVREDAEAAITVKLFDGAQKEIGHLDRTVISNGTPLDVTSALPWTLNIVPGDTGEDNSYFNYHDFKFAYGDKSWSMANTEGETRCNVGGRDTAEPLVLMTQDMDCFFPC